MSTVEGSRHWRGSHNPFPPAAVARVFDPQPDVLTIRTKAAQQVDDFIDGYLRAARASHGKHGPGQYPAGSGKVCVIQGDYGTGKTHLAIEIVNRVKASNAGTVMDPQVFYCVAPGGNFLSLYTGLMKDVIGPGEVLARVREFYADIVADALRERPYTSELVAQLERVDVDPQQVIDRYGLKEGALREELRRRLSTVTTDETFSRALMLLLQPSLQPLAWDWFVGGYPNEILAERGVTKPLQTDAQALEALGVIARLYGLRNRRFMLVIDELEKIAVGWDSSDAAKAHAFKTLLEVFRAADALLVVCGLSDIFEMLPPDPGRIDAVISPSPLTSEDIRWYIEEAQDRAFGRRVLEPFTDEAVNYIAYITSGVARDVLRLCYYAFEGAAETGELITPGDITMVARFRVLNVGVEQVRSDISDILAEEDWQAVRFHVMGDPGDTTVDFWLPTGERGGGCAIVLSDSVLDEQQARRLADQLTGIRSSGAERALILVVGGYLPAAYRGGLAAALDGYPLIVYNVRTFGKEFAAALGTAMARIGAAAPEPSSAEASAGHLYRSLRAQTELLARQQARVLRTVQELAGKTEERLSALQQSVDAIPRPGPSADTTELPAELELMFGNARRSLEDFGDVRAFVKTTFVIAAREPGERFPLTHRLRQPDAYSPIGVAAFLSDVLGSFRESIREWFNALNPAAAGPTPEEREWLSGICQTYEALYGVTPVFKLDPLPEMTALAGSEQDPKIRPSRSTRREALRQAFDGLGDRVYQAAMAAATGASAASGQGS